MKYDYAEFLKAMVATKKIESASSDELERIFMEHGNERGSAFDLLSNSVALRCAVTPECIKRRGTATIVEWMDGTQTKIVRPADEGDGGIYTAFCIALGKKLFGNNSALKRAVHKADESVLLEAAQEEKEKRMREHNARMRRQLKRAMKRIERAARRQLNREIIAQQAIERIAAEAEEA